VVFAADAATASQSAAWQCLTVTPGATEIVQASVLIPAQTNSQGLVALWFYTSPDCTGGNAGVSQSAISVTNGWQTVKGSVQVPASGVSMAVRLTVYKPAGQATAEALFDNVSVSKQ
jgi:hypothetical protein